MNYEKKVKGSLYGLVIGDLVGLRYENAKPSSINSSNIGKTCLNGAVSDDTEHMILITRSLVKYEDLNLFKKSFRRAMQLWLLTLPINIGRTTLYSIIKSFFSSGYGISGSGNGSVMRIAPIGLYYYNEDDKIKKFSEESCRITHNDEECIINSIAIAKILSFILKNNLTAKNKPRYEEIDKNLREISSSKFWNETLDELKSYIDNNTKPLDIVNSWNNKGAVGYTKYTTIISIYCWYKYYGDFEKTIFEIIKCGGDTDTNAAVAGSLAGAVCEYDSLPSHFFNKINDIAIGKIDIEKACQSILNRKNNISLKRLSTLGWIKNIILLFYFLSLTTYFGILNILKKKY